MSQDALSPTPKVRTGQTPTKLTKKEYLKRWRERFYDPAFLSKSGDLDAIAEIAWDAYADERKSPRTRKAGPGFVDPGYELSVEWLEARQAIIDVEKRQESPDSATRLFLICASPRTDQTCPSEMSAEAAVFDRYIGYYKPYAVSHDELDRDDAVFEETRNAARVLVQAVTNLRAGVRPPDQSLADPRPK